MKCRTAAMAFCIGAGLSVAGCETGGSGGYEYYDPYPYRSGLYYYHDHYYHDDGPGRLPPEYRPSRPPQRPATLPARVPSRARR
jgi:hypothetical protein